MTRIRSWALGATLVLVLLPVGTQVAFAQSRACLANAAAIRRECLLGLGGRTGWCHANYRDDVRDCHRFGRGWRGPSRPIRPVHRPPPKWRPSPPERPVPLPAPVRR